MAMVVSPLSPAELKAWIGHALDASGMTENRMTLKLDLPRGRIARWMHQKVAKLPSKAELETFAAACELPEPRLSFAPK